MVVGDAVVVVSAWAAVVVNVSVVVATVVLAGSVVGIHSDLLVTVSQQHHTTFECGSNFIYFLC